MSATTLPTTVSATRSSSAGVACFVPIAFTGFKLVTEIVAETAQQPRTCNPKALILNVGGPGKMDPDAQSGDELPGAEPGSGRPGASVQARRGARMDP